MTLEELIEKRADSLFKLAGFDADDAVILPTPDSAGEFVDDLDDILSEMGVEAFDDEEWINDSYSIVAVAGAGEDDWIVQAQAFFIHSSETDQVHVLEMAPTSASDFSELPVFAESLADFDAKII